MCMKWIALLCCVAAMAPSAAAAIAYKMLTIHGSPTGVTATYTDANWLSIADRTGSYIEHTAAPTATDDINGPQGNAYENSLWKETTSDPNRLYQCLDNTDGVAVWAELVTADLSGNVEPITIAGAAERVTGATHGEFIDFNDEGDDSIIFGGADGNDDTDIAFDLDGTEPRIYSPNDSGITIDEPLDVTAIINITNDTDWMGHEFGEDGSKYGILKWRNTLERVEIGGNGWDYPVLINNSLFVDTDTNNGRVGINETSPAAALDIRSQSSSTCLRMVGTSADEIADLYVSNSGNLVFDLTAGSDTGQFDFKSENADYGIIIRESDGTGTAAFANVVVVDATADYLNIVMKAAGSTAGLVLTEDEAVGVKTLTPDTTLQVVGTAGFGDDAGNEALFAADGELTLAGTARVKKAIDMSAASFEVGNTAPSSADVGNYAVWEYTVGDDSVITFELPHDWATGTDLSVKIDWSCAEGNASDMVKWKATWTATGHGNDEDLSVAGTAMEPGDTACPATAHYLKRTTVGTISGASLAAEDEIGLKIEREAATGTDPAADPYITHMYIEYTADKLGEAM